MHLNNSVNILIPDGESKLSMFVINPLSEFKKIQIHILSSKKQVECKFSNNIKSFKYYKNNSFNSDHIFFLKEVINKRKINILLPLEFGFIRFISANRHEFEDLKIKIIAPPVRSLDIANNKWLLANYLRKNKFPTPKTLNINHIKHPPKHKYPLILKPLSSWNGNEIQMINSDIDYKDFIKKNSSHKEYILQEYIVGEDYCINVLCLNGKILTSTIQKGILSQSNKFRPHLGFKFLYDQKLKKIIERLMMKLNWSGVANFDIRYDKNEDQYYIIEINPRFWGSVEASAKVGVNFPYLLSLTSLGIPIENITYKQETFVSNRGILKMIKNMIMFNSNNLFRIQNNALMYTVKDPLPKFFKYYYKLMYKLNLAG